MGILPGSCYRSPSAAASNLELTTKKLCPSAARGLLCRTTSVVLMYDVKQSYTLTFQANCCYP